MTYAAVDTAYRATRASGDVTGQIEAGMVRRAMTRIPALTSGDDQREWLVCQAIVDGTYPTQWIKIVMSLLDTAGQLAAPTDAQVDAQMATAFSRFTITRKVG